MQCGRGCRLWGRACPLPPPPRGWAGPHWLAPLDLLSPFFLRMASSVFRPVNFLSLFCFPQFKLVTHKSSLRLLSGHSGPVLTLSNAACSPFRPHLLVADAGLWGTFLLGVVFRQVICGFYLFSLPVRLPSEIQKLPPNPPVRGFLVFGSFLY